MRKTRVECPSEAWDRYCEQEERAQVSPEPSPEEPEPPCYRERDGGPGDDSWGCLNDHTGCLWNDGHNGCGHPGESTQPLEEDSQTPPTDPVGDEHVGPPLPPAFGGSS